MKRLLALGVFAALVVSPSMGQLAASLAGKIDGQGVGVPGDPQAVGIPVAIQGPFESWDLLSDPSNMVLVVDVAAGAGFPSGTPVAMNGISWDVTIATVGGSWLSEARVYFDDTIAPDFTGLFLTPGFATSSPGTGHYTGSIKLADYGIGDVNLPNGLLRMEFYEGFDDVADAIDGNWLSNSVLTVQVTPEPTSLLLLALPAMMLLRRR